jgi:hypothetical protein
LAPVFRSVSAEVGGWLGLLLGASIVSLFELIWFCYILARILILKLTSAMPKPSTNKIIQVGST